MPVADNLKLKRKQARLTQAQLAKKSGVSQQAISFIESNRNTPSEGTLRLLAKALNCTVAELLGEPDEVTREYTQEQLHLLSIVQRLNSLGVQKVIDYAADLAENEKYIQESCVASAG